MINICPVSNIRNSVEQYSVLTDDIEHNLNEADEAAERSDIRYSASKVFGKVRSRINERAEE